MADSDDVTSKKACNVVAKMQHVVGLSSPDGFIQYPYLKMEDPACE